MNLSSGRGFLSCFGAAVGNDGFGASTVDSDDNDVSFDCKSD